MAYNTPYTEDAVDATISVSAENTNVRTITIQMLDANGSNMDAVCRCDIEMLLNAAGDDFVATGGSTGIAATTGKVLALVAKKYFKAITNATGGLVLTWTDTGTEVAYLGLVLPNGRRIISSALTNA